MKAKKNFSDTTPQDSYQKKRAQSAHEVSTSRSLTEPTEKKMVTATKIYWELKAKIHCISDKIR